MVQITAHRAFAATLVLLASGAATGTAVADGGPAWWKAHPRSALDHGKGGDGKDGKGKGKGGTTTSVTTTTTTAATTPALGSTTTTTTTTATTQTTTAATPAPAPAAAAQPQLGRSVALATGSGTVLVRPPGGSAAPLTGAAAQTLPTGTRVDTRRGEVVLTSAIDARGTTQTGRFTGGVFEVRQGAKGYTRLVLVGGHWKGCATATARARAAYVGARATTAATTATKKKRPIRRLWGSDDHGRFQTQASGSVATVRGTRWLTEDSCVGTRTTVTRGAVSVRSRRTGRTVTVTAGHSVLTRR